MFELIFYSSTGKKIEIERYRLHLYVHLHVKDTSKCTGYLYRLHYIYRLHEGVNVQVQLPRAVNGFYFKI